MSDKPTFTMMIGLPGSGKSTYAKRFSEETNALYLGSDDLREQMTGNPECFDKDTEVFAFMKEQTKESLKHGQSVVYDATNLTSKKRRGLLSELMKIPCKKECIFMAVPYEKCLESNLSRKRHVPEQVINDMYKRYEPPFYFEGWDKISYVYREPGDRNLYGEPHKYSLKTMGFLQDNPHHMESLGEHSAACFRNILDTYPPKPCEALRIAALLHDCGKPFTKKFEDIKGNRTFIAHYYGHASVGAYNTAFFDIPESLKKEVAFYVGNHMKPFEWAEEKTANKYKKIWGESLYQNVMLLHEADIKASIREKETADYEIEMENDL